MFQSAHDSPNYIPFYSQCLHLGNKSNDHRVHLGLPRLSASMTSTDAGLLLLQSHRVATAPPDSAGVGSPATSLTLNDYTLRDSPPDSGFRGGKGAGRAHAYTVCSSYARVLHSRIRSTSDPQHSEKTASVLSTYSQFSLVIIAKWSAVTICTALSLSEVF